jgi:hypothetical protein
VLPSPIGWIPDKVRRPLLGGWTLLVLGLSAWMAMLGQALTTDVSPNGIVSFELARTAERAAAILSAWNEGRHDIAVMVQGADWLYLVVYPTWFCFAAVHLSARLSDRWRGIARGIGWTVLLAAPFDLVENHALNQQLAHGADTGWAQLAWTMAIPKFALVALGAVFVVVVWVARLFARMRG